VRLARLTLLLAALLLAGCGGSSAPQASPTVSHAAAASSGAGSNSVAWPAAPKPKHPKLAPRRPAASHRTEAEAPPAGPASATPIDHGPRNRKRVALTFDADMTQGMLGRLRAGRVKGWYDARIVRLLRATNTPSTIFLTGLWTQTYPNVVRSLAADPLFELENHSIDHDGFERPCFGLPTVPAPARKRTEVTGAARSIAAVTGRRPRYFRYPGGCHSAADDQLVASLGETPVLWDVVSGDPFQPNPKPIVSAVLGGVHPGSIVVMHIVGAPNTPATYDALTTIIPALKARGYRFVTLQDLLA
jgi:peptidoglycan/xylan/chitin deacetylase (PgdA/CDA1 family)